jgi:L-lactate dehydrogenase complex protein LldG
MLKGMTCIIQKSPFLQEVFSKNADLLNLLQEDLSMDSDILAEYEVGVTTADFLVARTGSILLSSISGGGRRLSVLPPVHVVIAREEQIVNSLEEALQSYTHSGESWSYATIITGPSRTSDIEKQLVLGAHGPKRLVVVLIRRNS